MRMYHRGGLIGIGLVLVAGGVYALAVGRIKWDKDRALEGSQARLAGIGALVGGAVCVAIGLFVPGPIWEAF